MQSLPVVVIRPFRPEDNDDVQKLIKESTLAPVNEFFIQALTRELFFQVVVLSSAIMFIFVGVPFHWTLSSLPIVAVIFYVVIAFSHYYKAKYLHHDLKDITKSYLGPSHKTCFFVAEAFGDIPASGNNRVDRNFSSSIAFVNSAEFDKMKQNRVHLAKSVGIIGTIGITRQKDSAVIAWIRRMAVKKEWRQNGIGSKLLDTAIQFCHEKSYVSIELLTTECHHSARRLYEQKGFETKEFYRKKFCFLSSLSITMNIMTLKTIPTSRTGMTAQL